MDCGCIGCSETSPLGEMMLVMLDVPFCEKSVELGPRNACCGSCIVCSQPWDPGPREKHGWVRFHLLCLMGRLACSVSSIKAQLKQTRNWQSGF